MVVFCVRLVTTPFQFSLQRAVSISAQVKLCLAKYVDKPLMRLGQMSISPFLLVWSLVAGLSVFLFKASLIVPFPFCAQWLAWWNTAFSLSHNRVDCQIFSVACAESSKWFLNLLFKEYSYCVTVSECTFYTSQGNIFSWSMWGDVTSSVSTGSV